MPWYWILNIVSIIVGPFEALYVCNKAWKRRRQMRDRERPEGEREE